MMLRHRRALAAFGHDLVVAIAAWGVAYALRFNFDIPDLYFSGMTSALP